MQNKTRDPCVDPIMPGKTIHPFDFQGAPTLVQGSTGGDPDELVNGGVNNVAGWIYAESDQPGGGNSSFVDTDVLGMAQTLGGPEGISQASFTYLTHYAPNRDGTCRRIPWDYDSLRFGPGAPVYDFYSVMLHEVGHNLGLGHHAPRTCNDPVSGARNVMQPQIFQGERFVVGSCELKAMQALYGAGGPCHLPDPAALPRGE